MDRRLQRFNRSTVQPFNCLAGQQVDRSTGQLVNSSASAGRKPDPSYQARHPWRNSRPRYVAALFVLGWATFQTGCVERRMTIRTNLDSQGGALVLIDNREVGVTPVSTGFTYYAPREIRLIKDGYETTTFIQEIPAPWWDSLPLEFFVENLLPYTLRDEREFHYTLQPTAPVSTEELLGRAEHLRRQARLGAEIVPTGESTTPLEQVSF